MTFQRIGFGAMLLAAAILVGAPRAAESEADGATERPRELGPVDWLRDFDAAAERARMEGKPLFLLFQEVPGCRICVDFGDEVLSHPLVREAIEDEFVPVAILNNRGGADRRVLERFSEPAWNNPVVRFVDATGTDLIPRRAGVWQPAEITGRMLEALTAARRQPPTYLARLHAELAPTRIQTATLAMGCYWGGEACLGALPGLVSTRTAHLAGREVVEVRFDAGRVSYAEVLRYARSAGCADAVLTHDDAQLATARALFGDARPAPGLARPASPRNQKYHLKRTSRLAGLTLTPTQASRVNHALWKGEDPRPHLSPRQRHQLEPPS